MKELFMIITVTCYAFTHAFAQNQTAPSKNNGAWFMYFGDNKIGGNWSLITDFQFRNIISSETQGQVVLRSGITYRFKPQVAATGGYGYIYTVPSSLSADGVRTEENRIWQQLVFNQWFSNENIHLEHRYRMEQRFIKKYTEPVETLYANRVRYRIQSRFSFGLFDKSLDRIFVNFYDEVFINFGGNVSSEIFDRNRAYAALGYFLSPKINLQVGYLHQYINIPNRFTLDSNHNLQVALVMNADFIKNN